MEIAAVLRCFGGLAPPALVAPVDPPSSWPAKAASGYVYRSPPTDPMPASLRSGHSNPVGAAGRSRQRCDQIAVPAGADETPRNGHTVRPLTGTCSGSQSVVGRPARGSGTQNRATLRPRAVANDRYSRCRSASHGSRCSINVPGQLVPSASLHSPMARGDLKRFGQPLWTLTSSAWAHLTASAGGMPWMAFAYMSTMMYLVCTSAAF